MGVRVGSGSVRLGILAPSVSLASIPGVTRVPGRLWKLGQQPDIWLLQETWLTDSKATAFALLIQKVLWLTPKWSCSGGASQTGCGGVAVLVRRGLSQKFGAQFSKDDCQGIFVWVQGLFVGSLYAPPHEHCPQIACAGFIDAMVAANVKPTNRMVHCGDFNETPSDGLFSEVMPALVAAFLAWVSLRGLKETERSISFVPIVLKWLAGSPLLTWF